MSFAGRWSTSFGPMVLTQDGSRVRGTYGREVTEHPIEGTATADEFSFRYTEPQGIAVQRMHGFNPIGGMSYDWFADAFTHALRVMRRTGRP